MPTEKSQSLSEIIAQSKNELVRRYPEWREQIIHFTNSVVSSVNQILVQSVAKDEKSDSTTILPKICKAINERGGCGMPIELHLEIIDIRRHIWLKIIDRTIELEQISITDPQFATPTTVMKVDANIESGHMLAGRGKMDRAIQEYERAIKQSPQNALLAHNFIGLIRTSLSDYEGAMKAFKKALEIDSADIMTLYNLCELFVGLNHYKQALQVAAEIVSNGNFSANDVDGMIKSYEIVELNYADYNKDKQEYGPDELECLGDILVNIFRLEDAKAVYLEANQLNPDNKNIRDKLMYITTLFATEFKIEDEAKEKND